MLGLGSGMEIITEMEVIQVNKIRDGATLKIHPETRDRLKDAGKKGETYDQIINRLLDAVGVS